jgi:CubicO group peptidase (beta-lactamase class C family)
VEHQIWLLRNVFWWYLLPFTISILAFFADVTIQHSKSWIEALGGGGSLFGFLLALYCFIDYINQSAVRSQLEPRRQELLALLASLGGDDASPQPAPLHAAKSVESFSVLKRWLIVALISLAIFALLLLARSHATATTFNGPPKVDGPEGAWLGKLVTDLRQDKHLVGLAAMVTVDGQLRAAAANGERMKGSGLPIEIVDRWHLGGITKSITATMIARLVERGQMHWSDTVGDVFPETSINERWKPVTLKQLLTDTAGAPPNFPNELQHQRPPLGPKRTYARREAVLNVIEEQPAYPSGEKCEYSNVGYVIAGAMAEKVTGQSWEDLVTREVFGPLQLADAGFGPPKSSDEKLEQPRGHRNLLIGKVAVDDNEDNTPIMGPSASIHMSLRDLCTYANEHMRGELGEGKLLSGETYRLLHTPELDNYAFGWVKNDPAAVIPFTEYWHNGSNTMWYALVAFIPARNLVVAVATNDGDSKQAEAAACEILAASVNHQVPFATPPSREKENPFQ